MSVKINTLEIENVKRIKVVRLTLDANGLTVFCGGNEQGKSSVLDAICYALGGERYKPTSFKRDGSAVEPVIKLKLSNNLTVERSGKNGTLKVTDPSGLRGGQMLLNAFVSEFALNLPKFLNSNNKDKAKTLLDIIGVGEELQHLEKREKHAYDQRHAVGVEADSKKKYADELPYFPEAPEIPIEIKTLILEQQQILMRNGANIDKIRKHKDNTEALERLKTEVAHRQNELNALRQREIALTATVSEGTKKMSDLKEESTEQIEKSIYEIEEINTQVRANLEKSKALDDAESKQHQYQLLTNTIEDTRNKIIALLEGANLPYPELSVRDGSLIYKDKEWDCIAASDQLKIAVAIVAKLKPDCGFVLLDKLEQMDRNSLNEFGQWVEAQGLQVIATRVSTSDECSIVLEDGTYIEKAKKWKEGEF